MTKCIFPLKIRVDRAGNFEIQKNNLGKLEGPMARNLVI